MKKILLITAALGLCAASALAQGQISFANGNTDLVITNNGTVSGSAAASASNFKVQLFYQPGSNPAPAPISISPGGAALGGWESMSNSPAVSVFPSAGKFGGGAETTGGDVAPNGQVWLEVVGWSGGFTSLQAAISGGAAWAGASTVWSQLSGSGAPGTPATIVAAGQFAGLTLVPIVAGPEPTTMAIAGLGAAALLFFRRKK